MQYEQAYSFLINKLEKELPSWLTYHNAEHTKSVIASAEYLAKEEGIAGEELLLLRTAALFHDAGFLENHNKHEEISCKLAKKYLPEYGYSDEHINSISGMIMGTKLPQTPTSELGKFLCDADLFYLGTEKYEATAERMFAEFKKTGFVKSKTEWLIKQADFLSTHTYFTQTAKREGEPHKQVVLQQMKASLKATKTLIYNNFIR